VHSTRVASILRRVNSLRESTAEPFGIGMTSHRL
jgi:hypothetical protein